MKAHYEDFGFYSISGEYTRRLQEADSKVQDSYGNKPFLGIIRLHDKYDYFVPLSSPKDKQTDMPEVGRFYFLVYEFIRPEDRTPKNIIREERGGLLQKLLGILSVNNMIPVPAGYYTKLPDFTDRTEKYNDLLCKEYEFCLTIKDKLLEMSQNVRANYRQEISEYCCDFEELERMHDLVTAEK